VRDATVDLGLALVRLEQRRHRLEDLFRDTDEAGGPAAGNAATAPGPRAEAAPDAETAP